MTAVGTYDGRGNSSPEELRRHANKALQDAKRRGKNQVWLYSHASADSDTGDSEANDSNANDSNAGDSEARSQQ